MNTSTLQWLTGTYGLISPPAFDCRIRLYCNRSVSSFVMLLFCVSVRLRPLPLWEIKCCDSAADSIHEPCICWAPAINSHMSPFVEALQSISYFSICHRYSLLCYLTSCSCGLPFVFAFAGFTLFLPVTQCDYDMAGDMIWYDMRRGSRRTNSLCCSPVRQKGVRISISWPTLILHSVRPSLCSTAVDRCISQ